MEVLWLRGWIAHTEWTQARNAHKEWLHLMSDAPAGRPRCGCCAYSAPTYRSMMGMAGPAAQWYCIQCLPWQEALHLTSVSQRPWIRPTLLRHYLQTLIGAHAPLKFIQEAGLATRRPICKHVYTLVSLPRGRVLPVSFTLSMGALQRTGHAPSTIALVGYLNCEFAEFSGGQGPNGKLTIQGTQRQWLHPNLQEAIAIRVDRP